MRRNGRIAAVLSTTFKSLQYKNFRYFWLGQCVSMMGTWMQRTAQVWLVYSLTKSAFLVGLLGACQFVPTLLFTLLAGVAVDRFPKRKLLLLTQSMFMLQAALMTALTFAGVIRYWHILVLSAFFGITQTLDMPARQSFFVELVGKKDLMNGISLNSSVVNLAKIIGPAVSGIVMVHFGVVFCFLLNTVSFVAVIAGLLMMKTDDTVPQRARRSAVHEVAEGLRYIRRSEVLTINVLIMAALATFAMNYDVIFPVYAREVLKGGATVYTNLMTAAGIGSFAAATLMAGIARFGIRKGMLPVTAAALTLLELAMLPVSNYAAALVIALLIGFTNLLYINVANSVFQICSSDEYRGRVMSVYAFLLQGTIPVGNFYAGSVMQGLGGAAGFPACGAATLLFLVPVFILKRRTLLPWVFPRGAGQEDGPG